MDERLAYLLGVMHDGYIVYNKERGQYGFEIEQKNKEFSEFLKQLIQNLFVNVNVSLKVRKRSWGDYYRIRVYSKKVYEIISKYSFEELLVKSDDRIKLALIRGLFDAEGSVTSNAVRIFNKNTQLLNVAKQALESLDIPCKSIVVTCKDVYQLPIYSKKYKNKFMELIQPKNPSKIKFF